MCLITGKSQGNIIYFEPLVWVRREGVIVGDKMKKIAEQKM